jgi:hypothetical protein
LRPDAAKDSGYWSQFDARGIKPENPAALGRTQRPRHFCGQMRPRIPVIGRNFDARGIYPENLAALGRTQRPRHFCGRMRPKIPVIGRNFDARGIYPENLAALGRTQRPRHFCGRMRPKIPYHLPNFDFAKEKYGKPGRIWPHRKGCSRAPQMTSVGGAEVAITVFHRPVCGERSVPCVLGGERREHKKHEAWRCMRCAFRKSFAGKIAFGHALTPLCEATTIFLCSTHVSQ